MSIGVFSLRRTNYLFWITKKGYSSKSGKSGKSFDLNLVKEHYEARQSTNSFRCDFPSSSHQANEEYRILLPPPNVTGNLHIGHAVTVTIEDALCRYQRLAGKKVTWYPGFDHAGIATQSVVEKKLFKETGKLRREMSNEEFIDLCQHWKIKRIEDITTQLNSIGCSLDWSKTFYTMDERFSKAVSTAFCQLYDEGLIFRDKRIINWCPKLQSAVSDQEVELNSEGKKICTRSGGLIEAVAKEQWFLKCDELHAQVMDALKNGEIRLKPETVEGSLVEWLSYKEPWCLSRQLLWGHRIPAYLDVDSNRWVAATSESNALKLFDSSSTNLIQDSDVLDTWFSSSLIPLVVAGWPEKRIEGSVLEVMETGHDILGFWVARMLTVCKRLTGYFPFTNVVLHGLVRDSQNRKMSKSLGNVIDPMDVIEGITLKAMIERLKSSNLAADEIGKAEKDIRSQFPNGIRPCGADALRFALLRQDFTAFDVKLDVTAVANEGYRYCNKLWNLSKYCAKVFTAADEEDILITETAGANEVDAEFLKKLEAVVTKYSSFMEDYEIHSAFDAVYKFVLIDMCDNYLETTKESLRSNDRKRIAEISAVLRTALTTSLKLLSTFMPYVSTYLLDNTPGLVIYSDQLCEIFNEEKQIKV